ncbi:hypothetical protein PYCCODRAFT_1380522 [Trametes coccinea BRFM310]|uniref:Voltage-gated hydrogen channel 1 n=1 Tax=Trametes coccinea (strain BRFM310) TaxID=1353009 RepID=A0A1Y2J5M7_TRAC3|nr:hypothetical protein PYCCODRAFT_1380522 [Trametes coccinea BRFM310]
MSEQDPLLPLATNYADGDSAEAQDLDSKSTYERCKIRTAEVLESTPLHYTVIALVLIDSVCVLADLAYTFLSEDCTPIEGPDTPLWLNILANISLMITTLFLVEIPVTIWALGLRYYNPVGPVTHGVLHFFDAAVILTTFVLEVGLRGRERELASLLVILRLWRLVKLVQGIAVSAGEIDERQAEELSETRHKLREALTSLQSLRQENQELRVRLAALQEEGAARDEL